MEQVKISSSQHGQAAPAARAKAPAQEGVSDSGNEAAAGGFLALLAAMGDMSDQAVTSAASDAALLPTDLTAGVVTDAGDASTAAAWNGLVPLLDGNARIATGVVGSLSEGEAFALGGRSQGLVAETMKLDTSVDLRDGPIEGATTGLSRVFSRFQGALAQKPVWGGSLDAAAGRNGASDVLQDRLSGAGNTTAIAQASNERATPGALHAVAAGERAASVFALPGGTELAGAGGLNAGAVSALASSQGSAASDAGRGGDSPAGSNAEGLAGSVAAAPESGSVEGAPTYADAQPVAAEEQVAEQVAYWINQKTQNAEITLHRDGQPVEVSVSLSGNEAHVAFRSDQQETRALLDQSMAQLSDLLRGEGLVLSGMSVGTSAQGGFDGSRDSGTSGGREGARQAQVIAKAPAGTGSLVRGVAPSDRAVDIFV